MRHVAPLCLLFALWIPDISGQSRPVPSPDEKAISDELRTLRSVPDDQRGAVTRDLAQRLRKLPPTQTKLSLAGGLANLSTEGDFGKQTLQEVATTLAEALREQPQSDPRSYNLSATKACRLRSTLRPLPKR